ncbi:MAG: deoxyribodipyrimidine photo-lyase, partial [Caulobacteraceae bacterium]|nr:deoxyribodipyrimidine photo-lyase [Caulobacteraceae bacterium]
MQKTQERASPVIVWFRQDLRLKDNPALLSAGANVIPVYILDETEGLRAPGGASRWWLDKSLRRLDEDLRALGSRLILRRGPANAVLGQLIRETGAEALHWNRLYDAGSIARDRIIKQHHSDAGIVCRSFNGALLNEPWEIANGSG